MEKKNSAYLLKFKKEISFLAKKYNLSEDEVGEIIDDFFVSMKSYITDLRIPTIKITNLGTFKPTPSKINYQIRKYIKYAKRSTGEELEKVKVMISNTWKVRTRLKREANGEVTWKDWRDKKLKSYAEIKSERKEQRQLIIILYRRVFLNLTEN